MAVTAFLTCVMIQSSYIHCSKNLYGVSSWEDGQDELILLDKLRELVFWSLVCVQNVIYVMMRLQKVNSQIWSKSVTRGISVAGSSSCACLVYFQ